MTLVASLAFSPALNDADDFIITKGYYQVLDSSQAPEQCKKISNIECATGGFVNCTITVLGYGSVGLYKLQGDGSTCSLHLYEP
ncbi:hypothetical protein GCM10022397_06460 [Flavivirga jejuensis]